MRGSSTGEIHRYPLRPEGYEEPLFPTEESRREVLEHLLEAPWLRRASELLAERDELSPDRSRRVESVRVVWSSGRLEVVRDGARWGRWTRRAVLEVLENWREVRGWWFEGEVDPVDRFVYRVMLAGRAVVDLARERGGEWVMLGVLD